MKQILITGKNSYIGKALKQSLSEEYQTELITVRGKEWEQMDFSRYQTVIHCAALVHQKERKSQAKEYKKINCDLTKKLAEKSKREGVKQFIFFSTMNVYGIDQGIISRETQPKPRSMYGRSKWQAEQELEKLKSREFRICIVRPPMVYGKEAKGNYRRLAALASRIPVFPAVENRRSMLYIENLCELIKILVEEEADGIFYPQNKEYVSTAELACGIANAHGRKLRLIWIPDFCIRLWKKTKTGRKLFGNLMYQKEISLYCTQTEDGAEKQREYQIVDFAGSVKETER